MGTEEKEAIIFFKQREFKVNQSDIDFANNITNRLRKNLSVITYLYDNRENIEDLEINVKVAKQQVKVSLNAISESLDEHLHKITK